MNEKNILLIIYLLIKFSLGQENNYCDLEHSCNNCSYCGEDGNNYCSCNFYNSYCYNDETSNIDFNSNFLLNYDGCLTDNGELQNICGESNIFVEKEKSKTIYFKSTSSTNFICYYIIQFPDNFSNKTSIEIITGETNPTKFNLYYIVHRNNNKKVTRISDTIIKNNYLETIELNFQKISVYLDITNPQNLKELSLIFTNKDQNQGTTIPTVRVSGNASKSSGNSNTGLIVGLILGGVALIIGIIITIILIKNRSAKKKKNNNFGNQSSISNNIDNNNQANYSEYFKIVNSNREKMDNLFRTEFLPKIYNKNNENNNCHNCTICMEDFINNSSKVLSTKCGHTFHHKCFKEWTYRNIICPKCPNCNYLILGPDSEINLESISIPPTITGLTNQGFNNTTLGMTH